MDFGDTEDGDNPTLKNIELETSSEIKSSKNLSSTTKQELFGVFEKTVITLFFVTVVFVVTFSIMQTFYDRGYSDGLLCQHYYEKQNIFKFGVKISDKLNNKFVNCRYYIDNDLNEVYTNKIPIAMISIDRNNNESLTFV
jgi:hypothetical protein